MLALKKLPPSAHKLITADEIKLVEGSKKPKQFAAAALRVLLAQCGFKMEQFLATETLMVRAWINAGVCARIKFTATPQSMHIMTTGFVQVRMVVVVMMNGCVLFVRGRAACVRVFPPCLTKTQQPPTNRQQPTTQKGVAAAAAARPV